jgi:hypothetical protein
LDRDPSPPFTGASHDCCSIAVKGGANRATIKTPLLRVIASEAKQSPTAIPGASAGPDCFASLAMTHVWLRGETQESLQPRDRVEMRSIRRELQENYKKMLAIAEEMTMLNTKLLKENGDR